MKILITGSSGLVGSELVPCLRDRGHEVVRLVRFDSQLSDDTLLWDPEHRGLNPDDFEGFDVVINLAGENISTGRWTPEKKKKINDSRVLGTHMLCELLARLESPPKLLINASAVGFYGSQGDKVVDEESPPGEGFLAEVCQRWEAATEPAAQKEIRVVRLRIGVILTPKGGALERMLIPFKLGLGGVAGSGKQYFSWISIDDLLGVFLHVIGNESIRGPINAVSPNPVTNRELTKTLGKVLRRPTIFPLPAFVARFVLGEMADALLLSSTRASPGVLKHSGYSFIHPDLEGALRYLL
ncbi:MAG: Epimerase family protein [Chlamydiae bacterium]|nr:Epimerase family protein [Chlamydiota bacterium]